METTVFLDSAPLSEMARPAKAGEVRAVVQWSLDCDAAGIRIVIPEIVDYEVRRELLRSGKTESVAELDRLKTVFTYLPLSTEAMLKAAELWATIRQQGLPTAEDANIDVDVILAAQALTCGVLESEIVVATINPRHLSRFLTAKIWQEIVPSEGQIP